MTAKEMQQCLIQLHSIWHEMTLLRPHLRWKIKVILWEKKPLFFHFGRLTVVKRKAVEMPLSEKIWGKETLDPLVFNLKYLSLCLNKCSKPNTV